MTRGRTLGLVGLTCVLVAYGASAARLWSLRTGFDIAVQSFIVFPACAAWIWLALPLARERIGRLVAAAALAGGAAILLAVLGLESGANVARLACFALVGYSFLSLFEELWWVVAVSALIPWVDAWSVAFGPTRYVVKERPGILEHVSVAFPNPGESSTIGVGPPDVLFFALFLAAADRFGLRVAWTWVAMTGLLGLTLVLVWLLDMSGLPALPAVSLGFLLPNADLVWRNLTLARARARERKEVSG